MFRSEPLRRAVAADHKERPAGVQAFDQADRQR